MVDTSFSAALDGPDLSAGSNLLDSFSALADFSFSFSAFAGCSWVALVDVGVGMTADVCDLSCESISICPTL
jgi:hypothetical protein